MACQLDDVHRFIVDHYDLGEMRSLCLNLSVDFDDLRGEGCDAKARELVLQMWRRSRFPQLLITLHQNHPDLFDQENLGIIQSAIDTLRAELPQCDTGDEAPPH